VWGADLTVVEREFTLVGVVPELDGFKDLAAQFKDAAPAAAAAAGKALAAD
jgi:FMN-dependent NADH-azoreductase